MKRFKLGIRNLIVPLILAMAFGLIACQRSGGGSAVNHHDVNWSGCAGCSGPSGPTLLNVQASTPDESVVFMLGVQAQPGGYCPQPQHKLIICAQGPATLSGSMLIRNNNVVCGAPLGEYQVRPLEPGFIGNAMIMGGRYEAYSGSGSRLIFRMEKGIMSNADGMGLSSASPNNRIAMGLILESVNGYSCGIMSTY